MWFILLVVFFGGVYGERGTSIKLDFGRGGFWFTLT